VKFSRLTLEECGLCPVYVCYTLAFALHLKKNHGINFSQDSRKVPGGHDWRVDMADFWGWPGHVVDRIVPASGDLGQPSVSFNICL